MQCVKNMFNVPKGFLDSCSFYSFGVVSNVSKRAGMANVAKISWEKSCAGIAVMTGFITFGSDL